MKGLDQRSVPPLVKHRVCTAAGVFERFFCRCRVRHRQSVPQPAREAHFRRLAKRTVCELGPEQCGRVFIRLSARNHINLPRARVAWGTGRFQAAGAAFAPVRAAGVRRSHGGFRSGIYAHHDAAHYARRAVSQDVCDSQVGTCDAAFIRSLGGVLQDHVLSFGC